MPQGITTVIENVSTVHLLLLPLQPKFFFRKVHMDLSLILQLPFCTELHCRSWALRQNHVENPGYCNLNVI